MSKPLIKLTNDRLVVEKQYSMLIFVHVHRAFIAKKWELKEADGPESFYTILIKSIILGRCGKTKRKGVCTRVGTVGKYLAGIGED